MNRTIAFDTLAKEYDKVFTGSLTGRYQRSCVRKWMEAFFINRGPLHILELNCGTGDDAIWLASLGHRVEATDASHNMIRIAGQKIPPYLQERLTFYQYGFDEIAPQFRGKKFDLIFSNFSGLNCIGPGELQQFNLQLQRLLCPGGYLAVVIFGKYTCWEAFYFLAKRKPDQAFRRWGNKMVLARLKENSYQPVYYYSVKQFLVLLKGFSLIKKYPVGLFIPPSYLEGLMQKNPKLFSWLSRFEKRLGRWPAGANFSDHTFLLLKKQE